MDTALALLGLPISDFIIINTHSLHCPSVSAAALRASPQHGQLAGDLSPLGLYNGSQRVRLLLGERGPSAGAQGGIGDHWEDACGSGARAGSAR